MIKGKDPALPRVEAFLISEWSTDYHFRKKAITLKEKNQGKQRGNVVL